MIIEYFNSLMHIIMKNKIYLLLTISSLLFLTACAKTQVERDVFVDLPKEVLSVPEEGDCNLGRYGMDCELVGFLEEELAWVNEDGGKAFCAYELLGEVDDSLFLQVLCEEYYVQDEKIICPDEESREDCFMAKDRERQSCQDGCETEEVEPYLAQGSGVSIPVKVTRAESEFALWQPRDGSLYVQDLRENFPDDIYAKLQEVNNGLLRSIVVGRAEKFFETEVTFEVSGEMNQECSSYEDCEILPFDYAMRSDCPHTMKCIDGQCVAGCYDSFDYTRFPLIK